MHYSYRPTGPDDQAVAKGSGKVHGIENLHVIDGSLMPPLATGNTNGPINAGRKSSRMSSWHLSARRHDRALRERFALNPLRLPNYARIVRRFP
jgi:GMC oxidoreductase